MIDLLATVLQRTEPLLNYTPLCFGAPGHDGLLASVLPITGPLLNCWPLCPGQGGGGVIWGPAWPQPTHPPTSENLSSVKNEIN